MKNKVNRLNNRLRSKTKFTYKWVVILGLYGTALLILLTIVFNLTDIKKSKATAVEIREVDEQQFTTEMSVPTPLIKNQKLAGPNTIFIHKIKLTEDKPSPKNE